MKEPSVATQTTEAEDAEARAIAKWNARADRYNKWPALGQDEKDHLIAVEAVQELPDAE